MAYRPCLGMCRLDRWNRAKAWGLNPPKEVENLLRPDCLQPFSMHLGGTQFFSEDVSHIPFMKDTKIERAFNDLMAANWDELPPPVVDSVTKALSKSTEDKTAHDALKNVFRAAEAIEEFTGIIMSLKMELTDVIGMSGENVKLLTEECSKALQMIFERYAAYLASFGPEKSYLTKKVEMELGTKNGRVVTCPGSIHVSCCIGSMEGGKRKDLYFSTFTKQFEKYQNGRHERLQ
ncbi:membrane anchor in succinate dehydrogenase complex [Castilleja foliolosa]|uniref:Membrane anchor in succinate dehydrogenase complex n=1 Tax=Castilleja foliolosa TaxID=1961234 RepID=A0ABD3E6Z9_9LAMI